MKILVAPDQFLKKTAKPVISWDKKLAKEAAEMLKILNDATDPEGVGLAATQVGLDKRFFIINLKKKPIIFVNPEITYSSVKMFSDVYKKSKDRWLEGCLSLPRLWGFVDRPFKIKLSYQTPVDGKLVNQEATYEDIESAYVQHEFDHLNGILFTDRIIEQKGRIFNETEDGLVPIKLA